MGSNKGFYLVEAILTYAILLFVMMLSFPITTYILNKQQQSQFVTQAALLTHHARTMAMTTDDSITIESSPNALYLRHDSKCVTLPIPDNFHIGINTGKLRFCENGNTQYSGTLSINGPCGINTLTVAPGYGKITIK